MTQTIDTPWVGLRSRFLDSLDIEEQLSIFDLSVRTAHSLHRWVAQYPLIRRTRVWPLAISVAAAAPFSSVKALISTARLSLWVFTLDDLFDEERVPRADLLRRAERYRAIAHSCSVAGSRDSMAAALRDVRDDLSSYPLFDTLGNEWATALCSTIDGMVAEYDWRLRYRQDPDAGLPTYQEYLDPARYSIGGPPHVWAAVITAGDSSAPRHLQHLREMECIASTCIRLANDLQSYSKELAEGKINSLILLTRSHQKSSNTPHDIAYDTAAARVRNDIESGISQLGELQDAYRTHSGRPEEAIANIARFVCDFYTRHD